MSRNRSGFTLIELLVVILIIGILASIAIPKLGSSRDRAMLASVRSDVRNAETAEEAYFSTAGRYGSFAELQTSGNFSVSPGTTMTITRPSSLNAGYTVKASNIAISSGPTGCSVQVGAGAPASLDSKITCP